MIFRLLFLCVQTDCRLHQTSKSTTPGSCLIDLPLCTVMYKIIQLLLEYDNTTVCGWILWIKSQIVWNKYQQIFSPPCLRRQCWNGTADDNSGSTFRWSTRPLPSIASANLCVSGCSLLGVTMTAVTLTFDLDCVTPSPTDARNRCHLSMSTIRLETTAPIVSHLAIHVRPIPYLWTRFSTFLTRTRFFQRWN